MPPTDAHSGADLTDEDKLVYFHKASEPPLTRTPGASSS